MSSSFDVSIHSNIQRYEKYQNMLFVSVCGKPGTDSRSCTGPRCVENASSGIALIFVTC